MNALRASLAGAACLVAATACATVSDNGLYYEFRSLGFTSKESNCLVTELDKNLSSDELGRLLSDTRFERNGGRRAAISSLMRDHDSRIREAIAGASRACLHGLHS